MNDTKIILVEGMPGTGKSTVLQFIHLQLQANGRSSRWWHEESDAHPVRLYFQSDRHRSWPEYCDQAVSLWKSYAAVLRKQEQIAVIDAAILQNHVRSMLNFDCDRGMISELIHRIEEQIKSLNPRVIYLKPNDIARNFRDVVEIRGERMMALWIEAHNDYPCTRNAKLTGYPSFIAFWREFSDVSDRVFQQLGISKLQLDVFDSNREAQFDKTLEFLDCPRHENSSSPNLSRLAGKYDSVADDNSPGFMLHARDGYLVASVDQPTIDVAQGPIGCFREVRLIPTTANDFYVEAWPHNAHFTVEAEALVQMEVNVSEDGWPKSRKVYVKQ